MAFPLVPVLFAALGSAAVIRGVWRPHRAVARRGTVARCEGANKFGVCDPTMLINTDPGTLVYATAKGKVVVVGDDFLHIVGRNEAIIQLYQGLTPDVVEGQHVGKGQTLGKSTGPVSFGVWQIKPAEGGGVILQNVPPSAWMAARGARAVVKNLGEANKWCEDPRNVTVPSAVRQVCAFKKPDPSGFALLPVQIELEG